MFSIRLMHDQDIPAILDIQTEAYASDLLESEAIIRARRASAPRHAWVAEDDQGVCAYLFAYHSRVGKVTPLDGEFRTPAQPDCLYLHDLAVARRAAGRRIGPALVREALGQARQQQLRFSALIADAGDDRPLFTDDRMRFEAELFHSFDDMFELFFCCSRF